MWERREAFRRKATALGVTAGPEPPPRILRKGEGAFYFIDPRIPHLSPALYPILSHACLLRTACSLFLYDGHAGRSPRVDLAVCAPLFSS